MIPINPLQEFRDLDRSSPQFHEQLSDWLQGNGYQGVLPNLQGEDLAWLVEYLDSLLTEISDHATPIFQEALQELGKICGSKQILPKLCALPESRMGCVYEGTFNGSKVRIRRVRACPGGGSQKVKEKFYEVAAVSKHLTHPNIVPILGATTDPLELISEWMPGGDLIAYIANNADTDRLSLLFDVAKGLNYLHSRSIIHGDLNGSSILVDATGHARIIDFGLTLAVQDLSSTWSASVNCDKNVRWIAPEILHNRGIYNKETDIFSFAGVTIEVFTGAAPFSDKPPREAVAAIVGGERPLRPNHPSLTDRLWASTQRCWDQEIHLRPTAPQVLRSFEIPAWKRLVDSPLSTHSRISLIELLFSDRDEVEMVKNLCGDDAQAFVDVVDETLDVLDPPLRRKCLSYLCRICGRQGLLPKSMQIPQCYNPMDHPLAYGGFAEVWKGRHQGREVAVKVLKVYQTSDLGKITRRFCKEVMTWKTLCHENVLPLVGVTMSGSRFSMVSEWMTNGTINEYIREHDDVNRFELLGGVIRGLMFMHNKGMIHGDLKGDNILINRDGRACLADFGLIAFVSDPEISTSLNSYRNAGTTRWMSPERLDPEHFGFEDGPPTKDSDCYALGMVILEVLSGQAPFADVAQWKVAGKVIDGERPERPEGAWFTDDLWETLERCWSTLPKDRPTVEAVLDCVGRISVPQLLVDNTLHSTVDHPSARVIPQSTGQLPVLPQSDFLGVLDVVMPDVKAIVGRTDAPSQDPNPVQKILPEVEDSMDYSDDFTVLKTDSPSSTISLNWHGLTRLVEVPQTKYMPAKAQANCILCPPIEFWGIKLMDALDPAYSGLRGSQDAVLNHQGVGSSISCRLNFAGRDIGRLKTQTTNYKNPPGPITRKRLAWEVARFVLRYMDSIKVEPGCADITFESMVLVRLVHVSKASWQPKLYYEVPPVPHSDLS